MAQIGVGTDNQRPQHRSLQQELLLNPCIFMF